MVIAENSYPAQTVKKVKMTLIKSISGTEDIRNIPGESLSDYDINQFTLAYHQEIISRYDNQVVLGGCKKIRNTNIRNCFRDFN